MNAIDGGFDPHNMRSMNPSDEHLFQVYWGAVKDHFEVILLNPEAWKCVGKTKGWMFYRMYMMGMVDYMITYDKPWEDYLEKL